MGLRGGQRLVEALHAELHPSPADGGAAGPSSEPAPAAVSHGVTDAAWSALEVALLPPDAWARFAAWAGATVLGAAESRSSLVFARIGGRHGDATGGASAADRSPRLSLKRPVAAHDEGKLLFPTADLSVQRYLPVGRGSDVPRASLLQAGLAAATGCKLHRLRQAAHKLECLFGLGG